MTTALPAKRSPLLWTVAILLMLATVVYQRRTGPTHPLRGSASVAGRQIGYRFLRSEETVRDARVAIPDPGVPATLVWRRFPTRDPWTRQPLVPESREGQAELAGYLPKQPAAGKVEYWVEVGQAAGAVRIPAADAIVLRYKGPVPGLLLASHILMMFAAVLLGLRTGLGAAAGPQVPRIHLWVVLGMLTLGGLVLGPFVQKHAFGAYWTGFPWGYDLTDNKTLLMWLAWAAACGVAGFRPRPWEGWARAAVVAATLAMAVVYLIPHSLRGSQLDYSKIEAGTQAHEAVVTGH